MTMIGMCSICGGPATGSCPLCGRLVCARDIDPITHLCRICASRQKGTRMTT